MSYRKMDKHGSPQYCRHFLADNSIFHGRSLLRIVDIVMEHCYISLNLYKCSEGGFSLHHLQKKCSWHFYTQGGAISHIMRIGKFMLLIVWELAPTVQKRKKIIPCWIDDICLNWQLALNSNITTASITNGNRWFQHEELSPACLYTIWEDKVADVLNKPNISTLLNAKGYTLYSPGQMLMVIKCLTSLFSSWSYETKFCPKFKPFVEMLGRAGWSDKNNKRLF